MEEKDEIVSINSIDLFCKLTRNWIKSDFREIYVDCASWQCKY